MKNKLPDMKLLPRCRACGCDAAACIDLKAHDRKTLKANREAMRRWRKR
jgi:hypothetical protein